MKKFLCLFLAFLLVLSGCVKKAPPAQSEEALRNVVGENAVIPSIEGKQHLSLTASWDAPGRIDLTLQREQQERQALVELFQSNRSMPWWFTSELDAACKLCGDVHDNAAKQKYKNVDVYLSAYTSDGFCLYVICNGACIEHGYQILFSIKNATGDDNILDPDADGGISTPQPTPKPTPTPAPTPSVDFGDCAEEIVAMVRRGFTDSDVTVSWFVNGLKLSITIKVNELSMDDMRDFYLASSDPQATIDRMAEGQRSTNQTCCDKLREFGFKDFTVIFNMVTSDNFDMVTVENGEITYCISADNFRYG